MNNIAIEFEHVSKQYRLGLVSTKTLSHDIRRFWITNILGKEDPYLKIGEVNDRASKGTSEYVWALRDIDFKVEQGDVVGIIGKNGAGKSTLLKLLSRVTGPTTGTIRAHGRIGSLLEVGTGFHGEMTGRENIFMNGAILGMSRAEIQSKLDEIIDFSGCERYIDTPVKRYSSGMTVRLGFAVAAFLEPEILVVDEVLAVGDAEFQKKAIGKMKDVSQGQGRTVLFVSHNMDSVRNLCHRGIVLKNGHVDYDGDVRSAISHYLGSDIKQCKTECEVTNANRPYDTTEKMHMQLLRAKLLNPTPQLARDEDIEAELLIQRNNMKWGDYTAEMMIYNQEDKYVGSFISQLLHFDEGKKYATLHMKVSHHNLAPGIYKVGFNIGNKSESYSYMDYDILTDVLSFQIAYEDVLTHSTPSFWRPGWGDIKFKTGDVKVVETR